jgi:hypothetical protein
MPQSGAFSGGDDVTEKQWFADWNISKTDCDFSFIPSISRLQPSFKLARLPQLDKKRNDEEYI